MVQHSHVNTLYIELKTLPEVLDGLSRIHSKLSALCNLIDEIENLYTERLREDEILELNDWRLEQDIVTDQYRDSRGVKLKHVEEQLVLKRAQLDEELKRGERREREREDQARRKAERKRQEEELEVVRKEEEEKARIRDAYEKAFKKQMADFQKYGPPKPLNYQGPELAQISPLETEDKALEDFLKGTEGEEGDSELEVAKEEKDSL